MSDIKVIVLFFTVLIECDVLCANWTPLPTRHSKLLSLSPPDAPTLQSKASHSRSFQDHYAAEASNHFPLPIIEPHANGATVGLDLPQSNLRLLLDFDELASKPIAKHIGYKVIEREPKLKLVADKLSQQKKNPAYQATNVHSTHSAFNQNSPTARKQVKHVSIKGNVPKGKNYDIGFIRAADLHTAIKHRIIPEAHKMHKNSPKGSLANHKIPENFKIVNNIEHQSKPSAVSSNRLQFPAEIQKFKPQEATSSIVANKLQSASLRLRNEKQQSSNLIDERRNGALKGQRRSNSGKTNVQQHDEQQKIDDEDSFSQEKDTEDTQTQERDKGGSDSGSDDGQQIQTKDSGEDNTQQQHQQQQQQTADGQQNGFQEEDMQINNGNENSDSNDDFFEDNEKSARNVEPTTPATNAHQIAKKVEGKSEKQVLKETEKEEVAILKPFPKSLPLQATSCPISCIASCAPRTESLSDGSLSIVETANALECGDFVKDFPSFETIVQNLMDLSTNGYTLFLPTNNAYSRLPKNLIDHFKKIPSELNQLIENHFIMSSHTLEDMRISSQLEPRALNAKLRITSTNDLGVTVNGQRLVSANQKGPQSGVIHTIDGLLYPIANKDIMQTLKSCNRFDGFVTLADGTGISDILSKGGPYSVFVPSNEALQKIPDSDLNKIRSNLTALKDFLRYHISPGSHYSNDLRDAQFISTLLSNNAIKTGIRVDGCSRNLVEANVSPLYRADIPASNGVIHVLDWILKPEDHDWCENILLPR